MELWKIRIVQQILCQPCPLSSQLLSMYIYSPSEQFAYTLIAPTEDTCLFFFFFFLLLCLRAFFGPRLAFSVEVQGRYSTPRKHSSTRVIQLVEKYSQLSHFLVGKFWAEFYKVLQSELRSPTVHPSTHCLLAFSLPCPICHTSLLFIREPMFKPLS